MRLLNQAVAILRRSRHKQVNEMSSQKGTEAAHTNGNYYRAILRRVRYELADEVPPQKEPKPRTPMGMVV